MAALKNIRIACMSLFLTKTGGHRTAAVAGAPHFSVEARGAAAKGEKS